jgi:hypothetical protein
MWSASKLFAKTLCLLLALLVAGRPVFATQCSCECSVEEHCDYDCDHDQNSYREHDAATHHHNCHHHDHQTTEQPRDEQSHVNSQLQGSTGVHPCQCPDGCECHLQHAALQQVAYVTTTSDFVSQVLWLPTCMPTWPQVATGFDFDSPHQATSRYAISASVLCTRLCRFLA